MLGMVVDMVVGMVEGAQGAGPWPWQYGCGDKTMAGGGGCDSGGRGGGRGGVGAVVMRGGWQQGL